jgi:hypothetical protein
MNHEEQRNAWERIEPSQTAAQNSSQIDTSDFA